MTEAANKIDVLTLNNQCKKSVNEVIAQSELDYKAQLSRVVTLVKNRETRPHVLLLAGPSASSKTTTAYKIGIELKAAGIATNVISLDDFYVNRDELPLLANGETDYETIRTLDLDCLYRCLKELIETHKSEFPIFEFSTGKRADQTKSVHINGHTMLIIEGLHALNPLITKGFPSSEFLKLYICPTSDYYLDGERVLCARDVRLMRRIVRDHFHRASPINRTLSMWVNVVIAEVDSIIPFRDEANLVIDSTIIYEPCVFAKYLCEIISGAKEIPAEFSDQVTRLFTASTVFHHIPSEIIPTDTLLHEFLAT